MLNEARSSRLRPEARGQELKVKAEVNSSRPRSRPDAKIVSYTCQQSLSVII